MIITVLLSTFNGENFLLEQLDSLRSQTYSEFKVYIRDDGSTDNTLSILESYCSKDSRFILINSGGNVGCAESFLKLMSSIESDVYMFCDQDDVWLKDKIARVYSHFSKVEDNSIPQLYHSDLIVVDEKLDVLNNSFLKHQSFNAYDSMAKNNLYIQNFVVGCTMAVNSALADKISKKLTDHKSIAMHDWWAALVAKSFGTIHFDDEKTILYRQHSKNVLGAQPNTLRRFIRSLISGNGLERVDRFRSIVVKQAESFIRIYADELPEDAVTKLKLVINGLGVRASFKSLVTCFFNGIYMQGYKRNFALIYSVLISNYVTHSRNK
nr:glycosyltransferase family 2 protein [uncultured Enterobacter sp.]